MSRFVRAGTLGLLAAVWPVAALATEETSADTASRALPAAGDTMSVALIAVLAVLALFLIAGLGYLYRRERNLEWDFQRPDTPHDGAHH